MTAQDRRMRQVLAELELVSHGQTQSWNKSGGGRDEQILPPGESSPPHLTFRRAYERATTDDGRERVLAEASAELERIRGHISRPVLREETAKQWRARILAQGEGWPPVDVARSFKTSAAMVRRIRTQANLDPDTGKPVVPVPDDREERIRRARAMRAQGVSLRVIELRTGLPRSTLHRVLADAA